MTTSNEGAAGGTAPVRVLMVAIGGYGCHYLKTLLEQVDAARAVLAGVVDPWARQSPMWPEVERLGVPVANSTEAFFGGGHEADLAVVASPIHAHVPQTLAALARGADVLCDKPMGATVQEGLALIEAERRARRTVFIGYQWSYSAAIQSLKRDLLGGIFGVPLRLVTLCAWPRDHAYYMRNSWAGRLRDADSGAWVLDSPANNAMAHFLHNACYLLGLEPDASALPLTVEAELYRAFPIESADTAAARILTDNGSEIVFLASHATDRVIEPRFRLECQGGVITFGETGRDITAFSNSGTVKSYGDPDATPQFTKLFLAIDHAASRLRGGMPAPALCGPLAALAQTCCVNAMHESVPDIVPFPATLCHEPADGRIAVRGLADTLLECYGQGILPAAAHAPWARSGATVSLRNYRWFPGGLESGGIPEPGGEEAPEP